MAYAQSQYLRLYDSAGTYIRWQSYYVNKTVTWESNPWQYMPFLAEGFVSSITGVDADVTVSMPATYVAAQTLDQAILGEWLVELRLYQFDPQLGDSTPQVGQTLVSSYLGQVVSGGATMTRISMSVGSALSPVGSQLPPRKLTTMLMGMGVRS